MKLTMFGQWLSAVFNPKYQFTLSEVIKSKEPNKTVYVFKQYGSHEFVKLTFPDIERNPHLLQSVNPKNLMDINLSEFLIRQEYNQYYVTEEIRNNSYKIKNNTEEVICSGEYIYKNMDMFQEINNTDLCRIMYNTGVAKGRNLSASASAAKKLQQRAYADCRDAGDNVIMFTGP